MSMLYIFKRLNGNKKRTASNQEKHSAIPNDSIKVSIYNLMCERLSPHKEGLLLFKLGFKLMQEASI